MIMNDRRGRYWRQSFTGRQIFPFDPVPGEFALEDIAHGLAHIDRYGGQAHRRLSVAEHSVIVSLYGDPRYARRKLMHDACEAITGVDMPGPMKRHPMMRWWIEQIEEPIEAALWQQFDCAEPGDWAEIDRRILLDEKAVLFGPPPEEWGIKGEPLGCSFAFLEPEQAKRAFLERFTELFPEYKGP